jgi:hypothetical protein
MEGRDLSDVNLIDELRQAKHDMHCELKATKEQLKSYKMVFAQSSFNTTEDNDDETLSSENDDPLIKLGQLKFLYDLHKVEFGEDDQ